MQEDISLQKKNLRHPEPAYSPTRNPLHAHNSPLLLRQSKQVTILKLQKIPRCRPHGVSPYMCSPCSLSCTLACWSRSRYLILSTMPARLLCAVDKPSRQLASSTFINSHWLHFLESFLASPPQRNGSFLLASSTEPHCCLDYLHQTGFGTPVFLGSLNPLLRRPGSAVNASP